MVAEGGEGEVRGGGGEAPEAVGGVVAREDVVGEEGEDVGGGGAMGVGGDVGEGVVRGEEEGEVGGGGGVEEFDDFGVVVDEGGEAGGFRGGFEDLVDGYVPEVVVVAVVAVAGVLVVAIMILVLVVIVRGVEDGGFLLVLSGCYGTHESIPVQQSVPRVHGRGYIMLIGWPGRPKDNLIDFASGSFRSHQGSSEARRENQESLHLVDGTGLAGGGFRVGKQTFRGGTEQYLLVVTEHKPRYPENTTKQYVYSISSTLYSTEVSPLRTSDFYLHLTPTNRACVIHSRKVRAAS